MSRIRLQRYLSQAGVAARRKAERLITEERVSVNGERVTELGTRVDPDADQVLVDGEAVQPEDYFYAVFNKPKGCVTAVSDPRGRITVMDYLPGIPASVKPVGRLDFYSEGVLLLTNDGDLSAALQSPATHAEKTYHVKIKGSMGRADVDALRRGVRLEDGSVTLPAQVDKLSRTGSRHDWLAMTLIEGKGRQIHRMARALGYQVLKIQRVAFAGIDYLGLRVGDARELKQNEVNQLRALAGLGRDPRAIGRGTWEAQREESEFARRAKLKAAAQAAEAAGERPPPAPPTGRRGKSRASGRRRAGGAKRAGKRAPGRR